MKHTSPPRFLAESTDSRLQDTPPKLPFFLPFIRVFFYLLGIIWPAMAGRLAIRLFMTPRLKVKHFKTDKILESAVQSSFKFDNLTLRKYEWGQGTRVVLLLHGWESRGTALRRFVPSLLDAGFKVVTFDAPAHGDSEGKTVSLLTYGEAVNKIVKSFGGLEGIISHSFGAAAGVFAANRFEYRFSITKMVVIAAPANMQSIVTRMMQTLNMARKAQQYFIRMIEKMGKMPFSEISLANAYGGPFPQQSLIIHDVEDRIVLPKYAQEIADGWPNCALEWTKGFGHYRLAREARVIRRVTEFMKNSTYSTDVSNPAASEGNR